MSHRLTNLVCLAAMLVGAATARAQTEAGRIPSRGYALYSADGTFQPYAFSRHAVGDNDILIDILYAGICHSDLHHARQDWRPETYPMVPGHEILGRVSQVGAKVTKFQVGDYAGVGCMVNSCGECEHCRKGEEQYCDQKKAVMTYASKDVFHGGEPTQGGYSNNIVVSERFAIKVPADAKLEAVAPLMCAGITTYSPLRYAKVSQGDKVAVAGFGGLGHMAVQYAVSFGAEVTVFDVSEDKRSYALTMGAARFVNVTNPAEMQGLDNTFRVILTTIPARYDLLSYLKMLKVDGDLVVLGVPAKKDVSSIDIDQFVWAGRRKVYGSQIGGIQETQEMLDYSVAHNIYPRVEVIPIQRLDEAYRKVVDGQVKFRYVIDISTLDQPEASH
jgi:uncharacterized zinc-type alcohol dehydrogenase-like protein